MLPADVVGREACEDDIDRTTLHLYMPCAPDKKPIILAVVPFSLQSEHFDDDDSTKYKAMKAYECNFTD